MLGVDKIVTGHNADDIAETVLMNIHCKNSGGLGPPKLAGFTCPVLASKIGGHSPPAVYPPKMVGITRHSSWYIKPRKYAHTLMTFGFL